jgi:hypothetical protein
MVTVALDGVSLPQFVWHDSGRTDDLFVGPAAIGATLVAAGNRWSASGMDSRVVDMAEQSPDAASPVSADDVEEAVGLAVAALRAGTGRDWRRAAGQLAWDCWRTAEHIASDLVAYAGQLGARAQTAYVPFDIAVERDADPAGLLTVIQATGAMLAAIVRTTPAKVRAWHPYGMADPEGFAAMGIVETVVHTHDIATGLDLAWTPPASLCAKTLARLFPTAPEGDPWQVLLWATGRVELPGHERRVEWRWHGEPLGADARSPSSTRAG